MSDTTPGTWQPDPYGRFAQRYWDGAKWTENVIDAAGAQTTDPPVPSSTPYPSAAPGIATSTATSASGRPPTPALVAAGVGALLLLLSLFVLNWADLDASAKRSITSASAATVKREVGLSASDIVDGLKFSELQTIADKSGSDDLSVGVAQYFSFGYLLALVAVAFVGLALFQPRFRVPAIVVALVFAAWHGYTVNDLGDSSSSTGIGAWLGTIGLVIVAASLFVPRPAAATTPAY